MSLQSFLAIIFRHDYWLKNERFFFREFWVGMFPQILFGRGFFGIFFEEIFMQSLFGKELPVTECLVTFFSSDIFGLNSSFKFFC